LEILQEVSTSLEKKKPKKKSDFVYSFDGSGGRGPSKYKYRSVVERAASRNSKYSHHTGKCFMSTLA
jgi:hypothetical protein